MIKETGFISVKCGPEVTAALCAQCFCRFCSQRAARWSRRGSTVWSWQLRTDKWVYTPGGQRQPNPRWMRSVCAVSFGSHRGLSSSVGPPAPTEVPPTGPLCVDPAPCGLAALWPFTCDCVQSPCSPPSEPRASVSISNQLLTLRERQKWLSLTWRKWIPCIKKWVCCLLRHTLNRVYVAHRWLISHLLTL